MRSASSVQKVFVAIALATALLIAYLLTGMVSQGQEVLALLVFVGMAAVIGSLISLEFALLCLLGLAFTDGFVKSLDPTKLSVFAKDLFLAIALVRWFWLGLSKREWPSLRLGITIPAVLFIVYVTMQMFNTTTASWLIALAGFRTWVIWIPLAFITYEIVQSPRQVQRLMFYIVGLALLTSVYGIIQYNIGFGHLSKLGPGFDFYYRFGWGEKAVRATSTFVAPGAFGAAMSLSAIIAAAAAAFFTSRPLRILAVATAATCLVGLAASASRAPLLGLVVGGLGVLVLVRRPQFVLTAAIIALLFLWQLNSIAGGAFERRFNPRMLNRRVIATRVMVPFKHGLRSVFQHPLGIGVATGMGVGRGAAVVEQQELRVTHAAAGMVENEYGRALRELGLPGIALFLWLLYTVARGNLESYSRCRATQYRILAGACVGVTLAILAQLMVGSALYLVPSGPIFWIFYAISMKLPQLEAETTSESAEVETAASAPLGPAASGGTQ